MSHRPPKTHLRDIRLKNNAGIDFPLCRAQARLLDFDNTELPTSGDMAEVTCNNCKRLAPKYYPWAYGRKP